MGSTKEVVIIVPVVVFKIHTKRYIRNIPRSEKQEKETTMQGMKKNEAKRRNEKRTKDFIDGKLQTRVKRKPSWR